MGYNTDYIGKLKISGLGKNSAYALAMLEAMCGEDCRDHPEWGPSAANLTYLDVEVTQEKEELYLEWDGSEKTYDMAKKLNFITKHMRSNVVGTFALDGEFLCQGEDISDRYKIVIDSTGMAKEEKLIDYTTGNKVVCPNCSHEFELE